MERGVGRACAKAAAFGAWSLYLVALALPAVTVAMPDAGIPQAQLGIGCLISTIFPLFIAVAPFLLIYTFANIVMFASLFLIWRALRGRGTRVLSAVYIAAFVITLLPRPFAEPALIGSYVWSASHGLLALAFVIAAGIRRSSAEAAMTDAKLAQRSATTVGATEGSAIALKRNFILSRRFIDRRTGVFYAITVACTAWVLYGAALFMPAIELANPYTPLPKVYFGWECVFLCFELNSLLYTPWYLLYAFTNLAMVLSLGLFWYALLSGRSSKLTRVYVVCFLLAAYLLTGDVLFGTYLWVASH